MTSRKRNKASKGSKKVGAARNSASPSYSTEEEPADSMLPSSKQITEVAKNKEAGAAGGKGETPPSKGPVARVVYYDPSIVLPSADARTGEDRLLLNPKQV